MPKIEKADVKHYKSVQTNQNKDLVMSLSATLSLEDDASVGFVDCLGERKNTKFKFIKIFNLCFFCEMGIVKAVSTL